MASCHQTNDAVLGHFNQFPNDYVHVQVGYFLQKLVAVVKVDVLPAGGRHLFGVITRFAQYRALSGFSREFLI